MLSIFGLSAIPGDPLHKTHATFVLNIIPSSLQNILHIPLYAGLALSIIWCWGLDAHKKNTYLYVFLISTIFAISDEIHQMTVPGRFASMSDLTLDVFGILCGLVLAKKHVKYRLSSQNLAKNPP